MPGFEELHVRGAVSTALEAMGWSPVDAFAREAAPTAARGHSLVAVTPPSPAYAAPALAGLLSHIDATRCGILLAPSAELETWGALTHTLARGSALRVQVAAGEARALRRLRAGEVDLLIAAPETALALLHRSALKPDTLASVLLAWPERLEDGDTLAELMHDVPREAQRMLVTALPERAADLVERYARKAPVVTFSAPAPPAAGAAALGSVRSASVAWGRRPAALAEIAELADPGSMVVWAADRSYEDAIARALPLGGAAVQVTSGDAAKSELVIAFDMPDANRLAQLRQAGDVVLLCPPGTEAYADRIAPARRPLRLPGLLESAATEAAKRRALITRAIESGDPERALYTLAPLFERHDPTAVAAALYELWSAGAAAREAPATPVPVEASPAADAPPARVWVGIGKSDGVTANDFVGMMTKELRVAREAIGRIELRDAYSLIEVPAREAEAIARALDGQTIRRKRVSARVDRATPRTPGGAARPTARPPARGGSGGGPPRR